jgi:glycosyltransferase involved in cell wall biosynthesis
MKVLLISHGHPAFSIGGVEVASYNLFRGLGRLTGWESHYLARVGPPIAPHRNSAFMSLRQGDGEILYYANDYDYFRLSNRDLAALSRDLTRYLRELAPDVVHLHHILGFGVESIRVIREALPDTPIVLTLHEYLSICNNHGQLIKVRSGQRCMNASPADCNVCFAQISPQTFLRRELFLKSFFDLVDAFVSPSHFLIDRYAEWGLPSDKLIMLENGIEAGEIAAPRPLPSAPGKRNRFAYFGQLNQFKGIKVLLEAVGRIPADVWGADGVLNVYGGNLEVQPEAFQQEFKKLVAAAGRRVRFFGSYKSADLPALMRENDWLVVPSTWWENSPVVIQEAFLHGRPILCSDIGGMAEKIRDGVDGMHFRAGSAESLVDKMSIVLQQPQLWQRFRERIRPPLSAHEAAIQHCALYEALLARRAAARTSYRHHRAAVEEPATIAFAAE